MGYSLKDAYLVLDECFRYCRVEDTTSQSILEDFNRSLELSANRNQPFASEVVGIAAKVRAKTYRVSSATSVGANVSRKPSSLTGLLELARSMAANEDYDDAVRLLEPFIAIGDDLALELYAWIALKNPDRVWLNNLVEVCENADKHGSISAIEILADLHSDGTGVTQNTKKSIALYERAREMGSGLASLHLANRLAAATSPTVAEQQRAVELYQEAVCRGCVDAIPPLCNVLLTGPECVRDVMAGLVLVRDLVRKNHPEGYYSRGLYRLSQGDCINGIFEITLSAVLGNSRGLNFLNDWVSRERRT